MFPDLDQQFFVFIKGKGGIGKSRVVNNIQMRFFLFGTREKLVIFTPTGFVINSISRNTIHIVFEINNRARKNYQCKINTQL